jgi:hypothetical protein
MPSKLETPDYGTQHTQLNIPMLYDLAKLSKGNSRDDSQHTPHQVDQTEARFPIYGNRDKVQLHENQLTGNEFSGEDL